MLQKEKHEGGMAWRIHGDLSASLSQVAQALRVHSPYVAAQWRGEALAVCSDAGQTVGQVERGAVRPLGMATQAVHLVGHAADGRIWVQQRALDKANDPGLWDVSGWAPHIESMLMIRHRPHEGDRGDYESNVDSGAPSAARVQRRVQDFGVGAKSPTRGITCRGCAGSRNQPEHGASVDT